MKNLFEGRSHMRYRTLTQDEEHPRERWLATRALRLFSQKLGIPEVRLSFLKADPLGPFIFESDILGFCFPRGEEIAVVRGLCDRDLILVIYLFKKMIREAVGEAINR
jgi:hypothetical protein